MSCKGGRREDPYLKWPEHVDRIGVQEKYSSRGKKRETVDHRNKEEQRLGEEVEGEGLRLHRDVLKKQEEKRYEPSRFLRRQLHQGKPARRAVNDWRSLILGKDESNGKKGTTMDLHPKLISTWLAIPDENLRRS